MSPAEDYRYMARALQLARRGLYTADPNPRVGCVLVRDGHVVGEGWHERAGEDHAEINALRQAEGQARGATAYVTLEPCSHHGRTPPCSEALIEAGVTRVVAAMGDPNPLVAGNGLEKLREAGVRVEAGPLADRAEALNPGFVMRMRRGRPFVRCKVASSLDGRTALASGESQWITSPEARRDVHLLRARSSAIVTGIGTVLHDDPSLTVRLEPQDTEGEAWHPDCAMAVQRTTQPLRVVVDSRGRMPEDARMLGLAGRTLVATAGPAERAGRLRAAGAELVELPPGGTGVDLQALMAYLGEQQVNEVLVEAGARLTGALIQAGLVDELIVYVAPSLLGDRARGLAHLPGVATMAQRIELEIADMRAVGRDWRIVARIQDKAQTEERG